MPTLSRSSYLIDRQTDAARLKRIAIEEFRQARASGRLIAFIGSYATAPLGYPGWSKMISDFFEAQGAAAAAAAAAAAPGGSKNSKEELIEQLRNFTDAREPALDPTVMMDLAELATRLDRRADKAEFIERRRKFMKGFMLGGTGSEIAVRPNLPKVLSEKLGIQRFMTLNYDLELEWNLLTRPEEKASKLDDGTDELRIKTWKRLIKEGVLSPSAPIARGCPESRLERYIAGRGKVTSDVLDRDRSEILTEFALGSPWQRHRILHLHGRADVPDSLLITKRDYRDRYWQTGFSKLPFEYGMRLIFAGNPVLFAGIGAKEPDVMRTLEQFLSDNPNRRSVPTFLLWNSPKGPGAAGKAIARRLGFYRHYGIHVLFDGDIAELANSVAGYKAAIDRPLPTVASTDPLPPLDAEALRGGRRLEEPVKLLAELTDPVAGSSFWTADKLRTPQEKYRDAKSATGPIRIDMWRHLGPEPRFDDPVTAARLLAGGKPIKALIAAPGSARGGLAKAIATAFEGRSAASRLARPGRVVLINGSFAVETDAIFGILSGALDGLTAQEEGTSRAASLVGATRKLIAGLDRAGLNALKDEIVRHGAVRVIDEAFEPHRNATIIVNGMERFIGHDGSALSNELDHLIRHLKSVYDNPHFLRHWAELGDAAVPDLADDVFDYPINLILIGTARVQRYLRALTDQVEYVMIEDEPATSSRHLLFHRDDSKPEGVRVPFDTTPSYFNSVNDAFSGKLRLPPRHMDNLTARRFFLGQVLTEEALAAAGASDAAVCLEVLRTLAFIGQPVERGVLRHVPKLWELTGSSQPEELPNAVVAAIDDLVGLKLILLIQGFPGTTGTRLGLHKALIAELRERFGVAVSDARLSGGFNLSLTVAQAVDSASPELEWHDDLGKLVDFLTGAFIDGPPTPGSSHIDRIVGKYLTKKVGAADLGSELLLYRPEELRAMASQEYSACLRAALSIMRSYYSVPALLKQANRDLDPWMRDGPLSEHAERLKQLLRMARYAAKLRALVRKHMHSVLSLPEGDPSVDAAVREALGPNAFYPDDLVWLHNELGVVRATQGSLFEAHQAFKEAQAISDDFVEPRDRQQNWRRIQLNLAQVDIDLGEIERAEERLRDVEAAIEIYAGEFGGDAKDGGALGHIMRCYARDLRVQGDETRQIPMRVDSQYPTDIILAVALIQGLRGQCLHLRGALDAAKSCLSDSLSILLRLNEQRAYAYFQRQAAALHAALKDPESAKQALTLCIAAAGPSRQTDIDNSGRVALVQYELVDARVANPPWIMQLTESLRYATAGDMFRLQMECMQTLGHVYLQHGDADSALRYTNDSMAVAARCGFGLRMVTLRILMARILAFRGDTDSARALLESAAQIGAKLRHERAVESAENELIKLG